MQRLQRRDRLSLQRNQQHREEPHRLRGLLGRNSRPNLRPNLRPNQQGRKDDKRHWTGVRVEMLKQSSADVSSNNHNSNSSKRKQERQKLSLGGKTLDQEGGWLLF